MYALEASSVSIAPVAIICQRVVQRALERCGRLDVLVNIAGRTMPLVSKTFWMKPTRFWEVEPAVWQLLSDRNGIGRDLVARAVAPFME